MIDLMPWESCKKEFIREVYPDTEKVLSMKRMAKERFLFLNEQEVTDKNVSFIVEGLYEVIKELLSAFLLSQGLRSKNHQCLFSYFYKQFPEYEFEVKLILRLCYLRNRLTYYGEKIDFSFYGQNKNEIEKIIDLLCEIVK